MELNILYFIQSLRTEALDKFIVTFADVIGSKGEFWIILGIVLILLPKCRKMGLCVLGAYIITYYIGDGILKDLIARPRPCHVDESIALLIARPTSYSCPSVHSALAFASSMSIYYKNKIMGIFFIIISVLVMFSRMYLFVHYLTDVLLGAALGWIIAYLVYRFTNKA